MDSLSHVLIVVTIYLSLSFHFSSPPYAAAADAPSHLVRESCNKTTLTQWNYTFCVEALESDPRTASASDLLTLANIAIELAIANATKAQAHLYDMLKNSDTGSNFKAPLEGCVHWYDMMIESFGEALDGVRKKNYDIANYCAFIVGDYVDNCEKELDSNAAHDPSLETNNKNVKEFSLIGYVITDLLDLSPHPRP
ncbi:hypothetical protein L1049_025994 [Liquidambar formosana]|uniref:Pectinesterase inhibitor domain-containing protein n=1 Tax=Liquidambar formosana TaxID=63359 RepID=A0AAP0NCB0_LIQFO